jgi:hypothetical protein
MRRLKFEELGSIPDLRSDSGEILVLKICVQPHNRVPADTLAQENANASARHLDVERLANVEVNGGDMGAFR